MPPEMVCAEVYVSGRVQGVGYRYFTERLAAEFGIRGWSMNLPDGRVMIEIEADSRSAERFIKELEKGPPMARVSDVTTNWRPYQAKFSGFIIRV